MIKTSNNKKIYSYNAFKGIGSLFILFSHMSYLSKSKSNFCYNVWKYIMQFGSVFTTLFFLISGFLLAYTWKNKNFKEYIFSKLRRIYPLTCVVFILALVISIVFSKNPQINKNVVTGSSMWFFNIVMNIFLLKAFVPYEITFYSFHAPSWYISVLFLFYIFGYIFLKKINSENINIRKIWLKKSFIICILAYIVELLICIILQITNIKSLYLCYVNPYFRIFGECLAGILLCEYMPKIQKIVSYFKINIVEIFSLFLFFIIYSFNSFNRLNIFSCWIWIIPFGFLMIAFRNDKAIISRILKKKPFQFLGDISFELYMTHAFVYEGLPITVGLVSKSLKETLIYYSGTRFIITLILSIIFAWIVNNLMNKAYKLKIFG
ncbi:acyltransferase [Tissierellia bacterium KA00581]|nr:acyltransferase [Tissierellia bacterium KA00581]